MPAPAPVPAPGASDAAAADPLVSRPRISSIVLCALFGALFLALAAGTWWLAVRTMMGQQFDDLALSSFASVMPAWLSAPTVLGLPLGSSWLMISVAVAMAVAGLATALARRRWWLAGQIAAYAVVAYAAAKILKEVLPREVLVRTAVTESGVPLGNTSPSGHAALTVVAGLALTCAVPRAARAVTGLLAGAWSVLVSALLVAQGWHRPSDIVVAYLLAAGLALVALAFTRASGMDRPGARAASPGVQVTCSVLVTAAVMGLLYSVYVIWQLVPGLEVGAEWAQTSVCAVSMVAIASVAALAFGATVAMRQLTASPLS
ncbi:phosphatase PAP2 family protein, partial [Bifidobacterium moraviense]